MLRNGLRRFAQVTGAVGFCTLVLAAALAWRLSAGPVSLKPLAPLLERVLDDVHPPVEAGVADVVLRWAGWDRGIDVRLTGVTLSTPEQGVIATIPELGVVVSTDSLRQRRLLIEAVDVFGLDLRLIRRADGSFHLLIAGQEQKSEETLSLVLADVAAPPDPAVPASYLERVGVNQARVHVVDEDGRTFVQLRLRQGQIRRDGSDLSLEASLALDDDAGTAAIELDGRYRAALDALDLNARFRDLNPARLAGATEATAALAALDLPAAGTVSAVFDGSGGWRRAGIDVTAGEGRLVVSPELAARAGLPASSAQALAVRQGHVRLAIDRAAGTIGIEALDVRFAPGTEVFVPAPVDHRFPLTAVEATGRLGAGRVEVDRVAVDLGGPRLTATGSVANLDATASGQIKATLDGLAVDAVRRYWPPKLAPGGYDWTVNHLSGGSVRRAEVMIVLAGEGRAVRIEKLEGTIAVEGASVDYLPPLPPVRDAAALARFDLSRFRIELERGSALGLMLTGGTIIIQDFDKPVETIDLDLAITGPVPDALDLIGRKPLEYTKAFGVDPAKARGEADISVRLMFPLLNALPLDRVAITANARLRGAAIEGIVAGQSIENGNLDLRVDKDGLDLGGTLSVAGIPGRTFVAMNFAPKAPFSSRVEFTSTRAPVEQLLRLAPPDLSLAPYLVGGALAGTVRFTVGRDDNQQITLRADLAQAETALPELGWRKKRGARGNLEIEATARDGRLVRIRNVACNAADLDIRGSAQFRTDGGLARLDLARLAHDRTDITATVQRLADGGLDVAVNGPTLDLEPFLATRQGKAGGREGGGGTADDAVGLRLVIDLAQVWFGADRRLVRVSGQAKRERIGWSKVDLGAELPAGGRLSVTVAPVPPGRRDVRIAADNAGLVLATLGAFSDMRQGQLDLEATFDDTRTGSPLSGRLKVKDFNVVNAPLLARLLNVLALGGIVDALRGDGISFTTLDAPFTLADGQVVLRDAKTHGATLGLTASGTIDTTAETIDVQGTIVPFYLINSALGRLPLVGDLFTGGEAGGGLFAATYALKGALAEPTVAVNPLSILGPGVLRSLFSIFDPLWGTGAGTPPPPR